MLLSQVFVYAGFWGGDFMLHDIIDMLFGYGLALYQGCNIDFGDVTINLWWWVFGFAVLLLGCEIVGRILH